MKLTLQDYENIARDILVGDTDFKYEKDGETLALKYRLEANGYQEDDYFNGTGGWVTTSYDLEVFDSVSYDGEDNTTENDFDESKLSVELNKLV